MIPASEIDCGSFRFRYKLIKELFKVKNKEACKVFTVTSFTNFEQAYIHFSLHFLLSLYVLYHSGKTLAPNLSYQTIHKNLLKFTPLEKSD